MKFKLAVFMHTAGYLSFHPFAQCVVHALKCLACRARVTPASLPASHCRRCTALSRLRRLRFTRVAAPVLLAHAEVTKNHNIFQWVQNLGTPRCVMRCVVLQVLVSLHCCWRTLCTPPFATQRLPRAQMLAFLVRIDIALH